MIAVSIVLSVHAEPAGRVAWVLLVTCAAFVLSTLVYVVWTHLLFTRAPRERTRRIGAEQMRRGPGVLARLLGFGSTENWALSATVVAIVVAIATAITDSGDTGWLMPVAVLLTAAASWVTMVYAFALRYFRLDAAGEPITFDIEEEPEFQDFVSMSVMVSAVAAMSAGTPRTRTGLNAVRAHTCIALVFNALMIAMTVSLLTGIVAAG